MFSWFFCEALIPYLLGKNKIQDICRHILQGFLNYLFGTTLLDFLATSPDDICEIWPLSWNFNENEKRLNFMIFEKFFGWFFSIWAEKFLLVFVFNFFFGSSNWEWCKMRFWINCSTHPILKGLWENDSFKVLG